MGASLIQGSYTSVQYSGVGFAKPSPTQTIIHRTTALVDSGSVIYAVPAGKTFYCRGFSVGCNGAAAAGLWELEGISEPIFGELPTTTNAFAIYSGGVIFSAPALAAIDFMHSFGAGKGVFTIWGWIE